MPPSQFIIDFNRCFEPTPFNTGPRIPSKQIFPLTPLVQHESLPEIHRGDTPALTNSPSSVSSALPLESDEIKRIFSFPVYEEPEVDVVDPLLPTLRFSLFEQIGLYRSADFYNKRAHSHELGGEIYLPHIEDAPKDKLNPHAPVFVPKFSKPLRDRIDLIFKPELMDIPFMGFHPDNVPPPPGLPHPPAYVHTLPSPHTDNEELQPCIGPFYFPLLLHASLETSTFQERGHLMTTLVRSKPQWTMECLLELARYISLGALFPGDLCDESGVALPACAPSRYFPAQLPQAGYSSPEVNEQMKPENILADITLHLHEAFKHWHGDECAQAFMWHVRELVMVQFKHSWDSTNPLAVSFQPDTSPIYVRSCLALCRSIAALFQRGLFMHRHIDACVKILLQGLISVEYAEALVTLVLGCGPGYLDPDGEPPLGEYHRLMSLVDGIQWNPVTSRLSDSTSVVYQPWGQGQLRARLSELIDALNCWAEGWASTPKLGQ